MGYVRGTEVEPHYRDAKILAIGGGANEIMNEIIAKRLKRLFALERGVVIV